MRFTLILVSSFMLFCNAQAQENSIALFGGYSFGTGSVSDAKPTGYKINLLYEFAPGASSWSVGGSVGYISLSGSSSGALAGYSFKVQAVPICLVPKFSFGSEKFKGYLKGAIGTGITTITYTGTLVGTNDNQWGMTLGLGAGASYFLNDRLFLSADYEWLRISNIYEDSGGISSASAGIGLKF